MIYQISPRKAAKGHIIPVLCQVNNTWLEPTYYIYPWLKHCPCNKILHDRESDILLDILLDRYLVRYLANYPGPSTTRQHLGYGTG